MIQQKNNKYFVHTKVKGVSGAAVPGSYFGWSGKAKAKIHAQPLIRDIALNPEIVESIFVSNMIVKVVINGTEHPIGVLDKKYIEIGRDAIIKVKSYEITGYDAYIAKDYIRLGMNISFEIPCDVATEWLIKCKQKLQIN